MKIHDISVPISNTLHTYKGDPGVRIERTADFARGDSYTLSHLDMGAHTGTHVDAPLHFIRGGKTVDQLDLNVLLGPARVVDLTHVEYAISAQDLQAVNLSTPVERILFKTRNTALWQKSGFQEDFVGLGPDAAQWLFNHGVKLVGIDYLSIEVFAAPDHPVHHALLEAGVIIVEGLDLASVTPGPYELICLPLKIQNAEGAPGRVVLVER